MPSQEKKDAVTEIQERLSETSAMILADYRGLSVKDMQDLRRRMRENGCEIKVYKNRLTMIALGDLGWPAMDEYLTGPTAFALTDSDPVTLAKTLSDFGKEHDALTLKAGYVDGEVVGPEKLKALADLPSREELLAKLLGTLKNPMTGVVRVLDGPMSGLARTVRAIADQKAAA